MRVGYFKLQRSVSMLGQKATTTSMKYLNRVTNQPGEIMTLEASINSQLSGLEGMGIFTEYSISIKKENPPLKCICGISVYAAIQFHQRGMTTVTCYTSCSIKLENRNVTFCSTCNFGDNGDWYDCCLVEWIDDIDEERNTYPGKILGFFTMKGPVHAVL
jgi:hypothetical protein